MNEIKNIFKRRLLETTADTSDANPQAEMDSAVWEIGYPQLYDVFAKNVQVPKGVTSHIVPYPATLTVGDMTNGDFGVEFVPMTYVTIPVDQIKGLRLGWTREYLEDVAWDAMAPQLSEAGRAIEQNIFSTCLSSIDAGAGCSAALSGTLSYADIVEGHTSLAVRDYKCDKILVNPVDYASLLRDTLLISALYVDPNKPVRTGEIDVALGSRIYSSNLVTANTIYFIDSDKALALVTRRDRKTEEYSVPQENEYGIVASVRYGCGVVLGDAICKGTILP